MTNTTGTAEWSDSSFNFCWGCPHDCVYCYMKGIDLRFGRIKDPSERLNEKLNKKILKQKFRKRKGRIMTPTSHDITPYNVSAAIVLYERLLAAKNNLLITTKGNYKCMKLILLLAERFKSQVQLRLTITSINNNTLKEWEPNAPLFEERMKVLQMWFNAGMKTSVSIEPFLDPYPLHVIKKVAPYCTESIWLGIMSGKNLKWHSKEALEKIIEDINELPFKIKRLVRFKDSISNQGFKVK
jgi:DNA repair photolyase